MMKHAEKTVRDWKPTNINFGEGSIEEVGKVTKKYSDNALLIIGGGSIKKAGFLEKITDILEKTSIKYSICEGVEPNPSKETVYRITYHLLAGNFTCLLAIGGGSVIDAAKAAGILGSIKVGELDDYFGVGMVSKRTKKTMHLIVAPTTSGSGSEVTKFSVITDTNLGVKKLMIDPAIVPTEAIVDPELTYSCGRHVTLVSGLDTMTHLIEGFLNNVDDGVDPEANQRALIGLKLLIDALPRVIKDGDDKEARRMMSMASTLGGSVLFYKQAGGPHLNSFSWCNVMDHGEACAVMLPYYAAYYAPTITEKLKTLAETLSIDDSGNIAKDFAEGLLNFYKKLGFPLTLKEFKNFSEDLIDKAIGDASQNKMKLEAMPRPIPSDKSEEILRTIIIGAYNGTIDDILKL
ncbi:MAG: iron-containing alcohol dehydrogenase [Deltaproteobacteria bacterium]|nr:iron-containing alcohol dehydrogenase [Deltaproteobacteria bacterium]